MSPGLKLIRVSPYCGDPNPREFYFRFLNDLRGLQGVPADFGDLGLRNPLRLPRRTNGIARGGESQGVPAEISQARVPDGNRSSAGTWRNFRRFDGRWKLQNLAKLKRSSPGKHALQVDELRAHFAA
jgi:hypothetical protein